MFTRGYIVYIGQSDRGMTFRKSGTTVELHWMNYPKMEEIHYQTRWMLENMDWLKYQQLEGTSMKDRLAIGDFMIYIYILFCTKDGNSSNKTCPCGSFIIC
jgi:hypothetical protein